MTVLEDKAQKEGKHTIKNKFFASKGIEVARVPLPVGDYILMNDKVQDVISRKESRGVDLKKMDFLGTYDTVVDSKENMQEIYADIIGKSHARFRDECILAQNNDIHLIILVENEDGITSLDEVHKWQNPRVAKYYHFKKLQSLGKARNVKLSKQPPCSSNQLEKAMKTMSEKYGVGFLFCTPKESGRKILELLGVENES